MLLVLYIASRNFGGLLITTIEVANDILEKCRRWCKKKKLEKRDHLVLQVWINKTYEDALLMSIYCVFLSHYEL